MNRRRNLIQSDDHISDVEPVFGQEEPAEAAAEAEVYDEGDYPETEEDFWEEQSERRSRLAWAVPAVCILLLASWTGFFAWVHHQQMLAGATPLQWSQWISSWAVPAIFIVAVWMLIQRNSRREANRFAVAARQLSQESGALEERLKVVNRELSLARDFIASQSRDLESLGRSATERLNGSAEHLQSLIHDNSAQIETIGSVSDSAVANMEHLRNNLPVLTNAARDLSSQIGNAGNVAHSQVESLVSGFDRLNQFGEAGERHVANINDKVSATLASFDAQVTALGETTQARFGRLREISETFRTDMVETEETALQSIRLRADELRDLLTARHAEQRELEEAALANLEERLGELSTQGNGLIANLSDGREDAVIAWRGAIESIESHMNEAIARVSDIDQAAMDSARRRLAALTDEAAQADKRIAASLAAFDAEISRRRDESASMQADDLAALEERMEVFDAAIAEKRASFETATAELAERSHSLFAQLSVVEDNIASMREAGMDATAQLGGAAEQFSDKLVHSRELLEDNSARITQLTDNGVRLLEIIRSGAEHSEGTLANAITQAETRLTAFADEATRLRDLMAQAEENGERLAGHVEQAHSGGTTSLEQLEALEERIAGVAANAEALAAQTRDDLRNSIEALTSSAETALEGLRASQDEVVTELAGSIAERSRVQVAEAIRGQAAEVIADLEDAVTRSADRGQQTTKALRDQLALLNELAGNLEQRIAYARERAEEKVDSDFSRRMALITEALHSSSIDIAKAFDNEVSDTQWANYLKGDRGIFTRRAVRLLDRSESRAVTDVYEEDGEFRETVNRYIHDFEAMLREVLATRDGNSLAVTLLSSDTGKLYVVLAQAIERLRS